ncbi:hypothetical protein JCM14076_29410 [Methylosoma difficile]
MNNKKLIPFLLLPFFAATTAHAATNLIAIGEINANYQDYSTRTAPALESGVAGNLLGGLGSGLAYAGGNTFIGLQDRGPNANVYNAGVDNTTSFISRLQTLSLSLAPNPSYPAVAGSLPYIMTPFLTDTTLLSSSLPLIYGGAAGSLPSGVPSINTVGDYYFSGRSDNFDAGSTSTNSLNGRLDPEGVRVANGGKSVFISDEYGPYVYQFSRITGKRIRTFNLPSYYAASNLNGVGDTEISGNTSGRTANKGMEGLAITPDGKTLVGLMQTALIQDQAATGSSKYNRIVKIDIATGAVKEYVYLLTDGSGASEIVAISNDEFFVLERDGKGLADNSTAKVKKLYKISLAGATEVTGLTAIAAGSEVPKTQFLDVVAELKAYGMSDKDIPAKIESVTFGPDMVINGQPKRTLYLANDNDFLATITDSNHPTGIANNNKFFVFAVDVADLPTYQAQPIAPLARDTRERG